jgi:hypothetical protein
MKASWITIVILLFACLLVGTATLKTANAASAVEVEVGIWLVNVEKVDLAASSFKLDFYLWFKFNPSEISLSEVKEFEFINGAPTKYEIAVDEDEGYLEYRVRGDFIKTFDFTQYPFENQELSVQLEHKFLDSTQLVYVSDASSTIDPEATVTGWNIANFETSIDEHSYGAEAYSRFVSKVVLQRPPISAFIKSVLPISVITTIALLAFFISPNNFAQRIGLGVTTLLSATAFHLSLVNGIPPTGYLTFADRMMIAIYAIFLYNLSVSVYIMRLVDKKKIEDAEKFNKKARRLLPMLIVSVIIVLIVTQLFL